MRGVLIPWLVANLYSLLSKVLIEWALNTMVLSQHYYIALAYHVHNASRVIDVMDNKIEGFKKEIKDLKVRGHRHDRVTSLQGTSPHRSPHDRAQGGDSATRVSGIRAE
ncbi:hypothetical protein B296_00044851 [Ensete ventricosum]|uniref:Uncharacterized protein n=1 Tax=Ensete ventricosum TaxID=4639 RepID=A0A426Z9F3_ENSVE|nr:hypothetical protein B296_00044851 [Ensete ventricosum]